MKTFAFTHNTKDGLDIRVTYGGELVASFFDDHTDRQIKWHGDSLTESEKEEIKNKCNDFADFLLYDYFLHTFDEKNFLTNLFP